MRSSCASFSGLKSERSLLVGDAAFRVGMAALECVQYRTLDCYTARALVGPYLAWVRTLTTVLRK